MIKLQHPIRKPEYVTRQIAKHYRDDFGLSKEIGVACCLVRESPTIILGQSMRKFTAWTSTVQASTLADAVEKLQEELREGDPYHPKVLELP